MPPNEITEQMIGISFMEFDEMLLILLISSDDVTIAYASEKLMQR